MSALVRVCDGVAGLALGGLLAVVAGEILWRLLQDLSGGAAGGVLPGGIELARHALSVAVLWALPGAAARGLVRVDLLVARLPARAAAGLARFWSLALALVGGLAAWRLEMAALEERAAGEVTQVLALPVWTLTAQGAVALAALALVAALKGVR